MLDPLVKTVANSTAQPCLCACLVSISMLLIALCLFVLVASCDAGFTPMGPKAAFTPCLSALCRETLASTSVRHMCSTPRTALHWTCLWWMAGTMR